MQPFLGNRRGQDRPANLFVDPVLNPLGEYRLAQIQMLGLTHLQIGRAGNGRARINQVGRVQLLGTILALVAARAVVPAIGAGAFDIAVGQKPAIGLGIDHLVGDFADQPCIGKFTCEMLCKPMVPLRRRAPIEIEIQRKPVAKFLLHGPHLGAILRHRLARLGRRDFRRGAVFVGRTDMHDLVTTGTHIAGIDV